MEKQKKIKQLWILTILTFVIGYIIFDISVGLYLRDFYADYREMKVNQAIVENYNEHKDDFQKLINYVETLPDLGEIAFLKKNKFSANFSGHEYHPYLINHPDSFYNSHDFYQDSLMYFPIGDDDIEIFEATSWDILPNRLGKIVYEDTTLYSYQWHWDFEGNRDAKHFSKFLQLCNLNEVQLFKLQKLVQNIDCQMVSFNNKKIVLTYRGHGWQNYSYYINFSYKHFGNSNGRYEDQNAELPYKNITPLDSMIYSAHFKSGMYCGRTIF